MRFSGKSAADSNAHDGTGGACRAREASAQRTRPTEPAILVARIRRRLGFRLPAGLDPVPAYESHCENHNPNKHSCLLGGRQPMVSKPEAAWLLEDSR